jgi:hypothetical protein
MPKLVRGSRKKASAGIRGQHSGIAAFDMASYNGIQNTQKAIVKKEARRIGMRFIF